jgi:SpoVK/Ycf46/Vps4 family AAA+-type ATPase
MADVPDAVAAEALARAGQGIVDSDLNSEAKAAARAARCCLIEEPEHRLATVFCGRGDYDETFHLWPRVAGNLLLEALPAFVHSLGGKIVHALRIFRGMPCLPEQTTVTIEGREHRIMTEGSVCVWLPDERLVVSTSQLDTPETKSRDNTVTVASSHNATAFYEEWNDFAKQHNYLRGRSFLADGKIISRTRKYTWDSIQLPEATRQVLMTHVCGFLKNQRALRAMGMKIRRGLILSDPPGTGKTLLGKVLADTVDASFLWVTPRHITSVESFANLLHLARFVAPSILFLEDLDLCAEERGSGGSFGLGELMNQLDGAVENDGIVVIATTNRLEVVEKALRNRPGRFDCVLEFGPVDAAGRMRMLRGQLGALDIQESDFRFLVSATTDYTGAQLQEVADTICILAATSANSGDGEAPRASVNRDLISTALSEVKVAEKSRLGFRVA